MQKEEDEEGNSQRKKNARREKIENRLDEIKMNGQKSENKQKRNQKKTE